MSPTFALGIPHTPWRPERVESLSRLAEVLGVCLDDGDLYVDSDPAVETFRVFGEREPNHEWSRRMWGWGAEQDATHFVTLQDDVLVPDNFWPALSAMVEAVPDEVIGLEVIHPFAAALAAEGHRWFTTSDCLVGVGYVMPVPLLREFLAWRASQLKPDAIREAEPGQVQEINEDTLIMLWCLAMGRRIWHPLPTIIDHDTELASNYGNDGHQARRPAVRWDTEQWLRDGPSPDGAPTWEEAAFWRPDGDVPHLGRMPGWRVAQLAHKWVEGFGADSLMRALQDDGSATRRSMSLRARAKAPPPPFRLYLATPTRGAMNPHYHVSVTRLISYLEHSVDVEFDLAHGAILDADVVRRRTRFVRDFLASSCTHLLFVDDDVSFEPRVVGGMLASRHDFVACPYPKRDRIDWSQEDVVDPLGRKLSQRCFGWAVAKLEGQDCVEVDAQTLCAEVACLPLGCALISRACLEKMTEAWGEDLRTPLEAVGKFMNDRGLGLEDSDDGDMDRQAALVALIEEDREHVRHALRITDDADGSQAVAMFQLEIHGKNLYSEDYSFCRRWRETGGHVYMYLGEGSPVTHHGSYAFKGSIEAFGLRRQER
jgi:hypothetical protein